MKANKKISFFLILFAVTFLLAGCPALKKPAKVDIKPDSAQEQSNAMSKRFQDPTSGGQTAVDSAIRLAREHAELSEKMAVLKQKNQELIAENSRLKDRVAVIEPELKQAKKELAGANDLLIEMRIEMNNWKTNILGFRDEMRDADKAQLETLLKILEILGGEVKLATIDANRTEVSPQQGRDLTVSSPDVQSKPQSKETNVSGEPNE